MSQADFSCAICYDAATEPVVTRCGHLFCWHCLDRWLTRPNAVTECPVCRGRVNASMQGDIIPMYGKGKRAPGGSTGAGPHKPAPTAAQEAPRPAANRVPPPRRANAGQHISFGSGMMFFVFNGSPLATLLFVAVWAAYHFAPWREWLSEARDRLRNGGLGEAPRAEGQQQQQQQQQQEHHRDYQPQPQDHPQHGGPHLPSPQVMVRNIVLSLLGVYILYFIVACL